jgi:hypothetical protein
MLVTIMSHDQRLGPEPIAAIFGEQIALQETRDRGGLANGSIAVL